MTISATPYELLGGETGLRRLVDRFYDLMDELPEAWPARKIHPESLEHSAQKTFEFLSGWFGGPSLFIEKYGHPRLRMRHMPYAIGEAERDAWLFCMRQALAEQVADAGLRAALDRAFTDMADHLRNH